MDKSTAKAVLSVAALYMLSALPTVAADLILKVDNLTQTVSVTNTLPTKVTMIYLEGPSGSNLPLFVRLDANATVKAPLRFAMPDRVGQAACDIAEQRRFLSVEVK